MVSSTTTAKIGNCAPVAKEAGVKENEGCQGWTNWETWCIAGWIGNEQSLYKRFMLCASRIEEGPYQVENLAREMKEYFETSCSMFLGGWSHDMVQESLKEVNWQEMAEEFLGIVGESQGVSQ